MGPRGDPSSTGDIFCEGPPKKSSGRPSVRAFAKPQTRPPASRPPPLAFLKCVFGRAARKPIKKYIK
jgi:hypothetical protein